ncbi:hypothetical protein H2C83_08055 [Thermoactinomyces sp. AMNI-1]|uniref:Uncharacterized protein n=2 Tax=Thermoactinomyces mirandus TaxID=2756294 RepID=A0A7W2AS31_9BACL|nr:hypothetical protein [Thermoactinomyces mirandus]
MVNKWMNWYRRWVYVNVVYLVSSIRHRLRKTYEVKMGELVVLPEQNICLRHHNPGNLSQSQISTVFSIMDKILGDRNNLTPEEHEAFRKYQDSFVNKRLLQQWKKIRSRLYVNDGMSRLDDQVEAAFREIKPILYKSFYEAYPNQPMAMNLFTLRAFVWKQEYITRKFGLEQDHQCWLEILNMIDDLKKKVFSVQSNYP